MDPGFYRKSNTLYTKRVCLGHNIAEIDMKKNDTIKITLRTIDENGKILNTSSSFVSAISSKQNLKIMFEDGSIELNDHYKLLKNKDKKKELEIQIFLVFNSLLLCRSNFFQRNKYIKTIIIFKMKNFF